jgi:hypothetical protein
MEPDKLDKLDEHFLELIETDWDTDCDIDLEIVTDTLWNTDCESVLERHRNELVGVCDTELDMELELKIEML